MNCEQARQILMDLLYGEEGTEFTKDFKEHFAGCSACSAEYVEMAATRRWMASWPDEDPATSLVFVAGPSPKRRLNWLLGWMQMRPAPAFAACLLFLLTFLALANVRITWEEGRFGFQSGVLAGKVRPNLAGTLPIAESDMVTAVDRMLTESEARQNQQTLKLLQRLADTLEYKRQVDLLQVRDELGLLHQNYFQALEKNSVLLEQAAKVMKQNHY